MKCLNCNLYYQQLRLKCLRNLARHWLQAPWGWHDSVETCRGVITGEIIVHLLVIVQNNKKMRGTFIEVTKIGSYFLNTPAALLSNITHWRWIVCSDSSEKWLHQAKWKHLFFHFTLRVITTIPNIFFAQRHYHPPLPPGGPRKTVCGIATVKGRNY